MAPLLSLAKKQRLLIDEARAAESMEHHGINETRADLTATVSATSRKAHMTGSTENREREAAPVGGRDRLAGGESSGVRTFCESEAESC